MERQRADSRLTWAQLLAEAEEKLAGAGVPDADTDAWLLMEHCFSITKSSYYLNRNTEVSQEKELRQYRELLQKRAERIPLQYLTGSQWFMGLEFSVSPDVLIPRQDTETLVETVLSYSSRRHVSSVLDVCTGSGCIAVSLAHYGDFDRTDASDISSAALAVAASNAEKHHVRVRFLESDLLTQIQGCYDVIVSNPPYIESEVVEQLEPEVKDYEPRLALCGGSDGLDFYRRLLESAPAHLYPGGALFVEIGYNQWEAVADLFRAHGFFHPRLVRDLAGLDRVVWAELAHF